MKIRYLGHSCFEITSGNGTKIITDPYDGVGYSMPKGLTADIVTVSHGHFDHNYIEGVSARFVLTETSAFSNENIEIVGVSSYHDSKEGKLRGENIIYKLTVDGITLCHMGDIGEECSMDLVKKIGKVDVLLIPVGGTYTIDGAGAEKYIRALSPKMVIPMHYKPLDGNLDIVGIQEFLRLFEKERIISIPDGIVEINEQTTGILYMERVK